MSDIVARIRTRLASSGRTATPAVVAAMVREEAGGLLGDGQLLELVHRAQAELVGLGPLEPLLADPLVTDVLVNGAEQVWVDRGDGLRRADVRFPDDAAVGRLAQRLAIVAGRRLDEARPWVDVPLRDGVRLHAVLPPVAVGAPCLSLRLLRPTAFPLSRLIAEGTLTPQSARLLRAVVAGGWSFLVSGGTGSGKTTLLAALLGLVGAEERIVLIEDSPELEPEHPHVVRLAARQANVDGSGEVTLTDLVRQALRMRPDRLVLGEARGAEVAELLAALNTGHDGGAGTVHANSARDVPARMEALGALGGLSRPALHSQLVAAVRIVLHLKRRPDGVRSLEELSLLRWSDGAVRAVPGWRRDRATCPAAAELAELLGQPC